MAIQARFALVTSSFFALLASGAFAPAAAFPSSRDDASGLELLWVERLAEEGGSGASLMEAMAAEDTTDAWAEAFAQSSRLRATIVAPPYPLVINGQVQAFIERFTGSRREIVELWLNRSSRYLSM